MFPERSKKNLENRKLRFLQRPEALENSKFWNSLVFKIKESEIPRTFSLYLSQIILIRFDKKNPLIASLPHPYFEMPCMWTIHAIISLNWYTKKKVFGLYSYLDDR